MVESKRVTSIQENERQPKGEIGLLDEIFDAFRSIFTFLAPDGCCTKERATRAPRVVDKMGQMNVLAGVENQDENTLPNTIESGYSPRTSYSSPRSIHISETNSPRRPLRPITPITPISARMSLRKSPLPSRSSSQFSVMNRGTPQLRPFSHDQGVKNSACSVNGSGVGGLVCAPSNYAQIKEFPPSGFMSEDDTSFHHPLNFQTQTFSSQRPEESLHEETEQLVWNKEPRNSVEGGDNESIFTKTESAVVREVKKEIAVLHRNEEVMNEF
mmetsp:Transcript_22411/g.45324  ORF Transcript_22411/g.45324 Transcript_22411/m.45324 type:complete len:271 (+) Transcript_22411:87-899(+)|eukprot:CAMPEP_0181310368 /NCGR_PEP_ID=MMETSP1101-20121128/12549_1 /TAXON_ID=46948 /ORGANISM="Rhodomonas abbreviata, Strain Caron Lab Isolate" /LENGTH=270 /DNA_ID=CAMNT_0023416993 /DNA_START=64 /DNA_END=876 /DNA_ORIENTATION=-